MESRQLKYFIAVAEELHFGKAAKRLNMSQPPLSQQIIKFEEELGTPLFKRNKRSVALTTAGKSLLEDARRILKMIEQAEKRLKATAEGKVGSLRLAYVGPALNTDFPIKIGRFKKAYPDINFSMVEMTTVKQLEAIRNGSIDAGILRLFKHDTEGLKCDLFHSESYALIVPTEHKLASKKSVAISELAEEQLIFSPRGMNSRLHDEWMRVFSKAGFVPNIVQEAETKTAALALVQAGLGISIVPESLATRSPEGVVFKKLTGEFPILKMHLAYREDNDNPAVHNFAASK